MIERIHNDSGVRISAICTTLKFARGRYYHAAAEPTPTQLEDERIGELIGAIFIEHRRRYRYRRIHRELADHEVQCSPDRVRRLMTLRGLRALDSKRFTPITSDGIAKAPNQVPM